MKYWQNELAAKEDTTKAIYEKNFADFLRFINKNPDELIVQRQQDLLNPDIKIQRRIESQTNQIEELKQTIVRDNEYISSILSLLYDNKGKWETRENIKLGDKFIKLWQEAKDVQLIHMVDFLNKRDRYIPYVDILEELTKTLENILKPYEELKKTRKSQNKSMP